MLLSLRMALKKSVMQKVSYVLLIASLIGFIILNPIFKEIFVPDQPCELQGGA